MNRTITLPIDCRPLVAPENEQLIIRNWGSCVGVPKVSIACVSYNHRNFIEDALNGLLAQETDFPFEIIIRDDASDDGTREVLQAYAEKYPNIIKLFVEVENQWSKGVRPLPAVIPRTQANYIAVCEGDDYWISPNKIQKQYDAMRSHLAYDLCFHKARHLNYQNGDEEVMGHYRNGTGHVAASTIMRKDSGRLPTASMMLTRASAMAFVDFRNLHSNSEIGDLFLQAYTTNRGGAFFIDETWSVYREYVSGSWSDRVDKSDPSGLKKQVEILEAYKMLSDSNELSSILVDSVRYAMWKRILAVLVSADIKSADKRQIVEKYQAVLSYRFRILAIYMSHIPSLGLKFIKRGWVAIKPVAVAVDKIRKC